MNTYEIVLRLNTYSEDPTDWIIDAICDQLEDDESLASIHMKTIRPVYVRDILFSTREDALLYCQAQDLSPTLIHHKATNPKNEQETEAG